ncbi:hypothetical protein PFICI_05933 [Pestalotiopsis fici W106-1]|uniref:Uncharacterized protein n=1 Tax=Pestalotiopsis fici (strain W106-1 / CGMCC3.15140) TaxID=1229662 RepID=W3XF55_PESFW|nr:uncharacterized protein PFICI_05933 [Pestalotiopsis fici W106-1]ETS84057.1 hypothetical protein PFICI_05933 [Pestalotiopsis fici W106-1]
MSSSNQTPVKVEEQRPDSREQRISHLRRIILHRAADEPDSRFDNVTSYWIERAKIVNKYGDDSDGGPSKEQAKEICNLLIEPTRDQAGKLSQDVQPDKDEVMTMLGDITGGLMALIGWLVRENGPDERDLVFAKVLKPELLKLAGIFGDERKWEKREASRSVTIE